MNYHMIILSYSSTNIAFNDHTSSSCSNEAELKERAPLVHATQIAAVVAFFRTAYNASIAPHIK